LIPQKIQVKLAGEDADTAYVELPGHKVEAGIVKRTLSLENLIPNYKGPRVHFDFDKDGLLIGIEILERVMHFRSNSPVEPA